MRTNWVSTTTTTNTTISSSSSNTLSSFRTSPVDLRRFWSWAPNWTREDVILAPRLNDPTPPRRCLLHSTPTTKNTKTARGSGLYHNLSLKTEATATLIRTAMVETDNIALTERLHQECLNIVATTPPEMFLLPPLPLLPPLLLPLCTEVATLW